MPRILIVDDEPGIRESIAMILDYEGYETGSAENGERALTLIKEDKFDAVLLDINMPGMDGFQTLKHIREIDKNLNVVIISAYGNIDNAIKATRNGAFDFLEKPVDREKLLITVRNASETAILKKEFETIKKEIEAPSPILGISSQITSILEIIKKVAPTDARILILGENGTGKELVARAIHSASPRSSMPFVEVNCAAIPNELIESELFGHEKGSFTGAMNQRTGKFELADKGTLFLDEIGDMSLQAQAKVLRAIEDGKIERVGGSKKIPVDVRLVSATNRDLNEMIAKGEFREDLYHRLNVIPVRVPPLRERVDDIPVLVRHFAKEIATKHKKTVPQFADDAITLLKKLKWTGNVRELRNIIERIIILANSPVIKLADIDFLLPVEKVSIDDLISESSSFQDFKDKAEKAYILRQLEINSWNISKTAEDLDIQRSHLYNKLKKYGIEKGE
ncbi:MAG: sigma-54 dependent transcriptional regulator [Bacteroidetes bacterium]|nr:sigma-54 dependent transcriptional regulator [Bacteroidota bacterium]